MTIPMIPFFLPPMMKSCPEEESYLLPDDLFCQIISYCTVSLTLFLFLFLLIEHTSHHITDCCIIVRLLFLLEELVQFPNLSPVVLLCLPLLQCLESFFKNPLHSRFSIPKSFVDSLPLPLRWFASQRPTESLCYTNWTPDSGDPNNYLLFAEEYEE